MGIREEEKNSIRVAVGRSGSGLHAKSIAGMVAEEAAAQKLDLDTWKVAEANAYKIEDAVRRDADQGKARPVYTCAATGRLEAHDGCSLPLVPHTPMGEDMPKLQSTVTSLADQVSNWAQRDVLAPPGRARKINPTFDSRWSSVQSCVQGKAASGVKQIDTQGIVNQLAGGDTYKRKQRRSRGKPRRMNNNECYTPANIYTVANDSPPPTHGTVASSRMSTGYQEEVSFLADRIKSLEGQLKKRDEELHRDGMPVLPPPSGHGHLEPGSTAGSSAFGSTRGSERSGALTRQSRTRDTRTRGWTGARSVPLESRLSRQSAFEPSCTPGTARTGFLEAMG